MKRVSTKDWIDRAKSVHGDEYDYSNSHYINANTRVTVICRKHGAWQCHPQTHVKGVGCPVCSGRVTNTDQFIQKAREIYGERYDYSKSVYRKSIEKLTITCPIHGDFLQSPNSHLSNHGCPKCAISDAQKRYSLDLADFMERAASIHGSKFDYSQVEYLNAKTKIKIRCPKHGEFEQTPDNHLRYGCRECANEESSERQKMQFYEFKEKALEVHKDRYGYLESSYENLQQKLVIRCREHGEFLQRGASHLRGVGCPRCAIDAASARYMMSREDFITKATEQHANRYTYGNLEYRGAAKKVTVTCPEHGDFSIKATHLVSGVGCPSCAEYGFNPNKPAILYYLRVRGGMGYKIGITNRTVAQRFAGPDLARIEVLSEVAYPNGLDALNEEQRVLHQFSTELIPNCTLLTSGNTEIFSWDVLELDVDQNFTEPHFQDSE